MKPLLGGGLAVALLFSLAPASSATSPSLARRPFTVIAVIDSGIDPYHADFRRPELTADPASYIEGFPRSAQPMNLTFDADRYSTAFGADRKEWKAVKEDSLYWIPGTNIIGAIGPFDYSHVADRDFRFSSDGTPPKVPPFYDDLGHGTAVASLAGGGIHGPDSDDILIVAIKGFENAVRWAANQPWIDVITNSWWHPGGSLDPRAGADASRLAIRNGKIVCFSSGNYSHPVCGIHRRKARRGTSMLEPRLPARAESMCIRTIRMMFWV